MKKYIRASQSTNIPTCPSTMFEMIRCFGFKNIYDDIYAAYNYEGFLAVARVHNNDWIESFIMHPSEVDKNDIESSIQTYLDSKPANLGFGTLISWLLDESSR